MNARRLASKQHWIAASAVLLLLGATGCHKHARQSSRYPAPPVAASSGGERAGASSHDPDARVVGDSGRAGGRSAGTADGEIGGHGVTGRPFQVEVGLASWYGPPYSGRRGADGTVYDQNAMTAAHLTLPLGTVVRVTNLANSEQVVVKITDRGPFVRGRIIDLSLAAARASGVYRAGVVKVRVEAFSAPPLAANVPPGGRWCVQIGAFPTAADANQEKLDLQQRYTTAKVMAFQGPTGWWVRINPRLADRAHAAEVADSIHLPDNAQPYLTRTD